MTDCIFCKIVAGELPSHKVAEYTDYLAFLDINPVNPGHTLVIPKKHYKDFLNTPKDVAAGMMKMAKDVAEAIVKGLEVDDFNLALSNGEVAGQSVFHVHLHVIPRHQGDGFALWPQKSYKDSEVEEVLEKIKKAM